MTIPNPLFTANPAIKGREGQYTDIKVSASAVLKSWKLSLFSYEWLMPDGSIRPPSDLPLAERDKRLMVEDRIKKGQSLIRPVLGIGIMDNIEIGSGRDVFLTLAAVGFLDIPVHIPKSCEKEFRKFIVIS